jgi:hypothetical protein
LFYLPRIFVNLAMVPADSVAERERLLLMARKLLRFMTIIAVPAIAFTALGIGLRPEFHSRLTGLSDRRLAGLALGIRPADDSVRMVGRTHAGPREGTAPSAVYIVRRYGQYRHAIRSLGCGSTPARGGYHRR